MTQQQFDDLNLQVGKWYRIKYKPLRSNCIEETEPVKYRKTIDIDTHFFDTENWASDFYRLFTRQIISIK